MHLQNSWFSLQSMQHLLFKDIMHFLMWCLFAHLTQHWFFLQNLIMWSNFWHLKHCVMQQFFLNNSHSHSWYAFSILTFISWFVIASIVIFTMSDKWVFSLSATFLSQTILRIFRFSWSLMLFFISFLMTFFWLLMSIVMRISYVSTAKIRRDMRVKFVISFAHLKSFSDLLMHLSWLREERCFCYSACEETWSDFVDSLTRLLFSEESAWWSSSASSSASSLSAIFIMTSHFLQSDDDFSLRCCFLVDNSSLVTFAYDMTFNEKRVFFCICNCLLSSWTDVFSFCTFFAMNMFWVVWCFSSESSRR